MTREEIIKVFNTLLILKKVDCTKDELEECCKAAIKALEQEPKPMVEIDLDYVIKQKYIEREVLDKIRAEIETKYGQCDICEYDAISGWEQVSDIADILQIIDKYKAESEQTDGNVD